MSAISPSKQPNWRDASVLDVRLLGTLDFESGQFLQDRCVYDISGRSDRFGSLFYNRPFSHYWIRAEYRMSGDLARGVLLLTVTPSGGTNYVLLRNPRGTK